MPFSGQSPFLRRKSRGSENRRSWVSMPFSGQSPFLQADKEVAEKRETGVNALQRAIPISTSSPPRRTAIRKSCVNALQRAIPISTYHSKDPKERRKAVSMPFSGQSPFLQRFCKESRYFSYSCQCPSAGNPHFYFAGGYALAGGFNKDVSMPFSGQSPFLPLKQA